MDPRSVFLCGAIEIFALAYVGVASRVQGKVERSPDTSSPVKTRKLGENRRL